jgi:hypothetical protein
MTAVLMVGLVLAVGLSIDVSRIYMVRSGLQNAADAAALAAARELNSGTGGLGDAVAQAQAVALQSNKYGLDRTGSSVPSVTISQVAFAPTLDGPWYVGAGEVPAGVETTIKFVRVTTQAASVGIIFSARALGSDHVEQRTAVAGMSVGLNTICDFFPIALALTPANWATLQAAAPGAASQLSATYTDGITGSSASVADHGYAVLQIDCPTSPCPYPVNGAGTVETVSLAAGIPNLCASVGQTKTLDSSQAANSNNGRDAIARGANTRLDIYTNGPGSLNATTYPPDTNISLGLTATQYLNRSPITAPSHTGLDDRRILFMPIVEPVPPGGSPTVTIVDFGAFLLRTTVAGGSNCGPNTWCGADLQLEYLGKEFSAGRGFFDPNSASTSITKAVLYR